ncbi:MAG: hypothetical protein IJE43_13485 [Alphaproteobacteria bacterium]|nr:hypothetical protein [Alphaproteobacteria bacterium]
MKKFIFNFILYIVCTIFIFKPAMAEMKVIPADPNTVILNKVTINTQHLNDGPKYNPLQQINNNLSTIFLLPLIIDKIYPDEKIKEDVTPFLQTVYPGVPYSTLRTLGEIYKIFISLKRRYTYIVNKISHQIKADNMLPKDAPIVAEDGEYAIFDRNKTKQSAPNEYQVKYEPYKYLDYDHGEYGEPVRRRDKNYEEDTFNVNEVILAILKFDVPAFLNAINKGPKFNDGSREKLNDLGNGITSRLLLDTSSLGDTQKIRAVIEVHVPENQYINGDYINPRVKPQFVLQESPTEELNIKNYELYYPLAFGVIKNGEARRILIDDIRFPLTIHRQDITKGLKIKGTFTFVACTIEGECRNVISNHELSLPASEEYSTSEHDNYVTQGHTHIPNTRSRHAQLKKVHFDKNKNTLTVSFETTKTFSNTAVMVEDANGTNFINPQYSVKEEEIIATFDVVPALSNPNSIDKLIEDNQIAISASFNGKEYLRTISQINEQHIPTSSSYIYLLAFAFGLLLHIMPGIMSISTKLITRIWEDARSYKIYLRYCFSSLIAWYGLALILKNNSWNNIFLTPWLTTASILIVTSLCLENLNYMDYSLFRTFKRFIKKGYINGLFSVILITGFPMFLCSDTLSQIITTSHTNYKAILFIWLGQITFPLLLLINRNKISRPLEGLKSFNFCFNILYIVVALWLSYSNRGFGALLTMIIAISLTVFIWYIYPIAITETIKHTRSKRLQQELFINVQKHFLIAISCIYILSATIIWLIPIKQVQTITREEVLEKVKELNQTNQPVLLAITSNWSYDSLINKIKLYNLQQRGMHVISFPHIGNSKVVNEWLQTYNVSTTPLNVLFTKRHPKGLLLPADINQTNWYEATLNFNVKD